VATDARALELLREASGLSIDLEGCFLHRGEPVTHARTLEALWRSLARTESGRYLVRIGRESGYVRLEDAPYAVRGLSLGPAVETLFLSDGSQEPLRLDTLRVDREGVLHCLVKGDHRARFTRGAQVALGLLLEEDPEAPAGYSLVTAGRRWRLSAE
jgi:uncharacterized protein